uniref:Uncharacterized protein n=1 Tax=Oryza glumipatula TaxID=40148 RepID=A0A0E0AGB2_9ORYZ
MREASSIEDGRRWLPSTTGDPDNAGDKADKEGETREHNVVFLSAPTPLSAATRRSRVCCCPQGRGPRSRDLTADRPPSSGAEGVCCLVPSPLDRPDLEASHPPPREPGGPLLGALVSSVWWNSLPGKTLLRWHRHEPMVGSEKATSGKEDGGRDGELELASPLPSPLPLSSHRLPLAATSPSTTFGALPIPVLC